MGAELASLSSAEVGVGAACAERLCSATAKEESLHERRGRAWSEVPEAAPMLDVRLSFAPTWAETAERISTYAARGRKRLGSRLSRCAMKTRAAELRDASKETRGALRVFLCKRCRTRFLMHAFSPLLPVHP